MADAILAEQMVTPFHAIIGILVALCGVPSGDICLVSCPHLEVVSRTIIDKEEMVDAQSAVVVAKETHPMHFVAQAAYEQDVGCCYGACFVGDCAQGPPGFPYMNPGVDGFGNDMIKFHDRFSSAW